jgi:hypothetical protein
LLPAALFHPIYQSLKRPSFRELYETGACLPGNSELIQVSLKMYHMLLILQAQDKATEQNAD